MKTTILAGLLLAPGFVIAQPAAAPATAATARVVARAKEFLAALTESQRTKVSFQFDDEKQRTRWSNLPGPMFHREGLRLGDLSATQRSAVMALLSAALSKPGYEKVLAIMEGDEVLKGDMQQKGGGKQKGGGAFGHDEYYVSILGAPSLSDPILGAPSLSDPWMLQFGGHHLALNLTIVGSQGVITPSHTAAQPATYTRDGKTVRPLGAENDKAFALLHALDPAQQKQAILGYRVKDLVLGPGEDGKTIQPEGIKASTLTSSQQAMLLGLIGEWAGIVHEAAAAARMAEIKANIADTWFAWSGSTEDGKAAYFRIQGPTLVIEYAPQGMGGDPTMHIHTIYRDPTNDYGKKWVKR